MFEVPFYVSTAGSDSNPGTQAQPWLTIQHADSASRTGGDCINVAAGTYQATVNIQNGGTSAANNGYVVYRCQSMNACKVLSPTITYSLWNFQYGGNFVVVDGFELDGNNTLQAGGAANICFLTDDVTAAGTSNTQAGSSSHHIWLLNNIIHHCGQSGVQFNAKEWYYVIHNTTYHNAWNSGYNGSGISLWTAQCIEAGALNCFTSGVAGAPSSDWNYTPSGNDTATFNGVGAWTPFHNVISWNVSYNNRITALSGLACNAHTDGNGIIMDTFFDHFAYTLPYQYQTLVMNNVAYYNGGRGLHTVNGRLVTFANNTAFNNGTDGCETQSQWVAGDLDNAGNSNTWINNLALTVQSVGWLGAAPTGPNNCSLIPDDNGSVTGVTFNNNILSTPESADVVAPLVHACLNTNATNFFNCTNNKCSTDPGFVNATAGAASDSAGNPVGGTWQPGNDNLALTATSPAIGYVQSPPPSWLPAQNVDAGACHHSLTTCPNPGTTNY